MSTLRLSRRAASDVVDVDHLVDVVALENDFLRNDLRFAAARIERVEGDAEEAVRLLVSMAQRVPVEAQVNFPITLLHDLDVRDVVAGPRLRSARARALGLDPEDAVLQPIASGIIDQRDMLLRILDQLIVIVPGRHPETGLGRVELYPLVPLPVVQKARLAIKEGPNRFDVEFR